MFFVLPIPIGQARHKAQSQSLSDGGQIEITGHIHPENIRPR